MDSKMTSNDIKESIEGIAERALYAYYDELQKWKGIRKEKYTLYRFCEDAVDDAHIKMDNKSYSFRFLYEARLDLIRDVYDNAMNSNKTMRKVIDAYKEAQEVIKREEERKATGEAH